MLRKILKLHFTITDSVRLQPCLSKVRGRGLSDPWLCIERAEVQ